MAWVQTTKIPPNRRLEFTLRDFSGGLNNRSTVIEDNEASDLRNMAFLTNDVMEKRHGYKKYDDLILDDAITHVNLYRPYTEEDELIRATNREVYANGRKIADVQGEIDSVNYQGQFFFCDGEDLFVYGKHPSETGTYLEIIGTRPNEAVTLKVVNPPEGYEPLPKEHAEGKLVYNYDDMTVHYEPCLNELDDVYMNANVIPEHPRFIVVHKDRLYISGDKKDDDNVFISHNSQPFYFPSALPIQLPPNSDEVRGLVVYDDNVIVGRRHDIYRITGEALNPELGFELFQLRKINTHTGFASHKAIDVAHSHLFFMGHDGTAYAMTTVRMDERLLSTQIISQQLDLFKNPIGVTQDDLMNSASVFDGEYWYVNVGDLTLVYSYRHRAWTVYDTIDMNAPFYYFDKIIWGRKDGVLAEFSEDYLDDGRPIYAYWQSKALDFDEPSRYKQFREFYLVAQAYDDSDSDIRVTFEVDYADVYGSAYVANMIAIWGKSKFGDRFISRNINASIPFMIGRRARNLRIRFANSVPILDEVDTEDDLFDVKRKRNYNGAYVRETGGYYYYLNGEWIRLTEEEMNQPMLVYEVNGEYDMKGKR